MKLLHGTPLKRFLRDWRRGNPARGELALVLQSVSYPVNVGSLFRIADAVGVTEMVLCGITPTPPNATISKVGRNKHNNVRWWYAERADAALQQLKHDGYHIAALELTNNSLPYFDSAVPERVALVVGNEDHGVTLSSLELCDSAVFVPMFGKGQSMNVHVAAAVVLYHFRLALMADQ